MESPDGYGLRCGVFVAPLVEPGYMALSIRYAFPTEDNGLAVREATSPMAGLILEVPLAYTLVKLLSALETDVAAGKMHGFDTPFICGELGNCQVLYSVATDTYLVGFGVVAGYFPTLESVREPIERTLAMIKERPPWPIAPIEWLQRSSQN